MPGMYAAPDSQRCLIMCADILEFCVLGAWVLIHVTGPVVFPLNFSLLHVLLNISRACVQPRTGRHKQYVTNPEHTRAHRCVHTRTHTHT